ncbi:NUDIX domain-containing protein [Primorskyibacter sp. S187A]|uniref:NUDIX domain-containing protein n=1 Tax=Primorskyibacter sp. S187A TaxID=3415130 RepID=UPI003C7A217C
MRLAVRAVIVVDGRLLLVNAWPGQQSDLWCAPGGGVEPHASLPDNLAREVREETGLHVAVEAPCLVNEFHAPEKAFHQVEVFFRCRILEGQTSQTWEDPEGIVNRFCWVTLEEAQALHLRPLSLPDVAFGKAHFAYDALERLTK